MAIVLRSEFRMEGSARIAVGADARDAIDYREFVFRLALAICGERDGAEDVAQEVLLILFRHRQKLAQVDNPHAWIRRITVRTATRFLKVRRRSGPFIGIDNCTAPEAGLVAVYQVLSSLEPEQRAILGMALNQGLSYREIAEALDIPEGTVASRLSAAKKAFQKRWEA